MRLGPGSVPHPYEARRVGRAWIVARPEVLAFASDALAAAGTLFAYAQAHPDRQVLASGRGLLYAVPGPDGRWVVRRYRRGGLVAAFLADRYVRTGRPRPLAELATSLGARSRGVPTPEVVAAALYPGLFLYRAELATRWIPDAYDLATLLFGSNPLEGEERRLAWEAAGRLVRTLHARGVLHRDLNLKNILLEHATRPARAHMVDLDRCRLVDQVGDAQRRRMVERFRRSAEKWSRKVGRAVEAADWAAFEAGYRSVNG